MEIVALLGFSRRVGALFQCEVRQWSATQQL